MLHFVTINEAVCIKPWQYHMYGLFLLSPDPGKTSPPYRTAASNGKLRENCSARDDQNKKLSLFRVQWKQFPKIG